MVWVYILKGDIVKPINIKRINIIETSYTLLKKKNFK